MYGEGILKGFAVTLSYLFKKPFTIQYPEERRPVSERFRGRPELQLHDNGRVKSIEILVGLAEYGKVREPQWRGQFEGKKHGEGGDLLNEITSITGTTLTANHISEGVKRVLATYALFLAPKDG